MLTRYVLFGYIQDLVFVLVELDGSTSRTRLTRLSYYFRYALFLVRAIIVAGHAVFLGGPDCPPAEVTNDSNWTLLPYQKGEPHFYVAHIRSALDLADQDPSALVIFSGGFTRRDAKDVSEAKGYLDVAKALGLIHKAHAWTLEESARDSFDNCVFGIARFAQAAGELPEQVTVVSWEFKSARFQQHMETILFPLSKYRFVGVGLPDDSAAALSGEKTTQELFANDRSGYGPVLGEKKKTRNPFQNAEPYSALLPHLVDLLAYRGSGKAPRQICPWAESKHEQQ